MSVNIDIFDSDERIFINSAVADISLEDLTQERILYVIGFYSAIAGDFETISIFNRLVDKISSMSNEKWSTLAPLIPFPTPYNADDIDALVSAPAEEA